MLLGASAALGLCAVAVGVSLTVLSPASSQAGQISAAGNGSTAGTAASAQPTPPVPSSSTGPNVTTAGIAKTALQYPSGLKNQMLSWKKGRGGAAWSAVTAELGNVTQSGGAGLYPQLRQDCESLASSVQAARDAPPIPDTVMQRSYAKILGELATASTGCQAAITVQAGDDENLRVSTNKDVLNRSLAQFATETGTLYTVTAEIRTLRG